MAAVSPVLQALSTGYSPPRAVAAAVVGGTITTTPAPSLTELFVDATAVVAAVAFMIILTLIAAVAAPGACALMEVELRKCHSSKPKDVPMMTTPDNPPVISDVF